MPYPAPNSTVVGLDGLLNYTSMALDAATPGLGGNAIGLTFIFPVWFIIFFPLAVVSPIAAFTVASFVCWLLSILLMAMQLINPLAFGVLFSMWVAGAVAFYLQTRN